METLITTLIQLAGIVFDHINTFFATSPDVAAALLSGGGLTLAFAVGAVGHSTISEGVLFNIRRWHGSIDDQFAAIDNLVRTITEHQPAWPIPADLLAELTANRDRLLELIRLCRTNDASRTSREQRNSILKSTVGLCLLQVRVWAYGEYTAGVLTADDVHRLGFLLPGEAGGRHEHTEATDVVPEVKVRIINEDVIRVVIDQSAGENAAQVVHGWPAGVRNALIVINASDGKTEIYRQLTTTLHNNIRMPEGSRGKQFVIRAAFLKHVNDEPIFGNEPTFSMPLTTNDLLAALDRQHHEDFEEHIREVERQRQEIERLQAELASKQ
jgi:hypothetical protein